MRSDVVARRSWGPLVAMVALLVASLGSLVDGQQPQPRFCSDDPIRVDNDRVIDVRGSREIALGDYYDFIENTFLRPGDRRPIRAVNVNTIDEVPDSSWFTNRIGHRPMSTPELIAGPNRPVTFGHAWTIVRGKNRGFHPGFRAYDRSDPARAVYQLEVDPPAHPDLATGAEVVGTAFYHAFGYNTLEMYLAEVDPNQLVIDSSATIREAQGRRPFTRRDLEDILLNAARLPNGRIRVSAERIPEEDDRGRFEYHGTRPDDPNDIHPHEHRRELRGSRVFAAWLNHDDSRALNTQVLRHRKDGTRFLKYYMADFGSLFGSATRFPDAAQSGREYALSARPALLTFFSLGLYTRPWLRQPAASPIPAVGRFTDVGFDPATWVAEYPKAAYENMRADDAFWAARIVAKFDEDAIRALVGMGYSDPRAIDELTRVLLARRQRVLETWLTGINPIGSAALSADGVLTFDNVAVEAGVGGAPDGYDVAWSIFDNTLDRHTPIGSQSFAAIPQVRWPAGPWHTGVEFVSATVTTRHTAFPQWQPVRLYFRRRPGGWQLVGLDRQLPEDAPASR